MLDTNFIIYAIEWKTDLKEVFMEYGKPVFYTTSAVIKELNAIKENRGKKGRSARVAIELIKHMDVSIGDYGESADNSIIKMAQEKNAFVCTHDRKLIEECKRRNIGVVMLRNGKKIIIK